MVAIPSASAGDPFFTTFVDESLPAGRRNETDLGVEEIVGEMEAEFLERDPDEAAPSTAVTFLAGLGALAGRAGAAAAGEVRAEAADNFSKRLGWRAFATRADDGKGVAEALGVGGVFTEIEEEAEDDDEELFSPVPDAILDVRMRAEEERRGTAGQGADMEGDGALATVGALDEERGEKTRLRGVRVWARSRRSSRRGVEEGPDVERKGPCRGLTRLRTRVIVEDGEAGTADGVGIAATAPDDDGTS